MVYCPAMRKLGARRERSALASDCAYKWNEDAVPWQHVGGKPASFMVLQCCVEI